MTIVPVLVASLVAIVFACAPRPAAAGDFAPDPQAPASVGASQASGRQPARLRSLDAAISRMTDAPPVLWSDLEAGRYPKAIALLMSLEAQWAMDRSYNALLSEAAIAAKDYPVATLALERLVLLEPGNAGAWLDLAVASEAMGDTDTARRALDTLERDFPVPPGIRLVIASLRARMIAAGAVPKTRLIRASLLFGHDSNANGGLAASSLTLTAGGALIDLPVDPAYRPRASNLWLAAVDATGRWETPWGPLEGRFSLGEKRRSSEPDFDTRDVSLAAAGPIGRSTRTYWLAEWRRLNLGSELLVQIPRIRVNHEMAGDVAGCRPGVGAELENRNYRSDLKDYNARIFWIDAGVRCPAWGGSLNALVRIGDDRGPAERPGGDTLRQELALLWRGSVAPQLDFVGAMSFARAQDSAGYSPLISSGAARDIDRTTARAELAWRLNQDWQAVAVAERTRQTSNVGLFGIQQTVIMTGIRYQH